MNRLIYDISMLAGTLLASIGAGLTWGLGVALMVGGGLVIGLTFVGVVLTGRG